MMSSLLDSSSTKSRLRALEYDSLLRYTVHAADADAAALEWRVRDGGRRGDTLGHRSAGAPRRCTYRAPMKKMAASEAPAAKPIPAAQKPIPVATPWRAVRVSTGSGISGLGNTLDEVCTSSRNISSRNIGWGIAAALTAATLISSAPLMCPPPRARPPPRGKPPPRANSRGSSDGIGMIHGARCAGRLRYGRYGR